MEVLQNSMVVAILGKGDLVGCDIPSSLKSEALIKSSSDVKALTYCDLKSIHISGLLEVLRLYPEFAQIFCTEIVHDLTFNLREGYDADHDAPGQLHNAHSLTLPSISEDDEEGDLEDEDEDQEEEDNSDHDVKDSDDSNSGGGGSPPAATPTRVRQRSGLGPLVGLGGGGAARRDRWPVVPSGPDSSPMFRKNILIDAGRRPALRMCTLKSSSKSSERSDDRDSVDDTSKEDSETTKVESVTRKSLEKLDSQINCISQDVARLSNDVKVTLNLVQKIFAEGLPVKECLPKTQSMMEVRRNVYFMAPRRDKMDRNDADNCSPRSLDKNRSSSSSLELRSLQIQPEVVRQNRASISTQTDRSLLDELLVKLNDSASPPPTRATRRALLTRRKCDT